MRHTVTPILTLVFLELSVPLAAQSPQPFLYPAETVGAPQAGMIKRMAASISPTGNTRPATPTRSATSSPWI